MFSAKTQKQSPEISFRALFIKLKLFRYLIFEKVHAS